ncbi:MAG: DUF1573 domain-containing protein [Planctomycetota bacterium]
MHLPEASFDLGRTYRGGRLEQAVRIVNLGETPLRIDEIETSCRCTATTSLDDPIPPGEFRAIEVSIETDRASPGAHTEALRIHSNDPENPVAEVPLQYEVWHAFLATPFRARFQPSRRFEEPTTQLSVLSMGQTDLGTVQAEDPSGRVAIESIEPLETQAPGFVLVLRLNPGLEVGEHRGEILVRTDDPERPQGRFLWHATVLPDIEFFPKRQVDFGELDAGTGSARTVTVKTSSGQAVAIESVHVEVESHQDSFRVEWTTGEPKAEWELVLRVEPGVPEGRFSGILVVKTGDADLPERRLPFVGIARSR